MGTSKSMPTPTGGKWTDLKAEISSYLAGGSDVTPHQIIKTTLGAAGGLPVRSPGGTPRGSVGGGGGRGGGGGGGGGGGRGQTSVGGAVSGLGGFGSALSSGSLGQALTALGMGELEGRPATEVIAKIAEHLSSDCNGLEQDVLRGALQQALLNAAEMMDDLTYENLEASLQDFISREGVEGLLELFLTQYVFDRVWLMVEDYASRRTDSQQQISSLESAVEHACRVNVKEEIAYQKEQGTFSNLDWFGHDGLRVADSLVSDLERRLTESARGGGK
ncbi:MAG: hypothetical protein BWX70_00992 [Verrucomicrobia bacterium ADurb.Bin070]|nr:MAG: hypothetical protein BWX70_00992 [Verrucomicrobia bacterium ADurb.Bin070]